MKGLPSSCQKRDSRQVGPLEQVNSIYDQLNRIMRWPATKRRPNSPVLDNYIYLANMMSCREKFAPHECFAEFVVGHIGE